MNGMMLGLLVKINVYKLYNNLSVGSLVKVVNQVKTYWFSDSWDVERRWYGILSVGSRLNNIGEYVVSSVNI